MQLSLPIRTERLVLRPFVEGDIEDLYAYLSLPIVSRYLYGQPAADLSATRSALSRRLDQVALESDGDMLCLAVEEPELGRVVGDVSLRYTSSVHHRGEIGYVFNPEFHGNGFATEATREMLAVGFGRLGLHRIVGQCDDRNVASAAVMERLGMRREAHFVENEFVKGEWQGELVFAILETEWNARDSQRFGGS